MQIVAIMAVMWGASCVSAFMMPSMGMGGGGMMPVGPNGMPMAGYSNPMSPYSPMNPSGYHIVKKRRHRGLLQRVFNVGPKYRYKVQPNYYRSGMYGTGMGMSMGMGMGGMPGMSPMGMPPMGMSSMGMSPMGMSPMGTSYYHQSSYGMGPSSIYGSSYPANTYGSTGVYNPYGTVSALATACRSQDNNSLRSVNCGALIPNDLSLCFNIAIDPLLTGLVRKCKSVLTANRYQLAAHAVELILADKPMAFGHLVTRGTCGTLGPLELDLILKAAVMSRTVDTFSYVDYLLTTCRVPVPLIIKYQTKALLVGNTATAMRLQYAALYPAPVDQRPTTVYLPSGRIINLNLNNALAMLTGRDMAALGKVGKLCSWIRPEHLTNPLFPSDLLSEMNENCFSSLRPQIFFFFTNRMIRRLRWWRSATPLQLHSIMIGPPIQSVPFYLLGLHTYVNALDRLHPCAGISKIQRASIMMNKESARAYWERCRVNGAFSARASVMLLALLGAAYLFQALFF
jgi:hypothetical protein